MIDTNIADADVLAPEELREIAKHAGARRYPAKVERIVIHHRQPWHG